ncbi:hypothetical protein IT400_00460 [Candidatus Nomurabacteria bacterium]|nr:hypothetical protein [Candidatus Nomurabacteria bacterium]
MKSIQHLEDKIKSFGYIEKSLILQVFIVIFVALGAFILGRMSMNDKKTNKVEIIAPENGKLYYSNKQ